MENKYLTVKEAATFLGKDTSNIRKKIKNNRIRGFKEDNIWYICKQSLIDYKKINQPLSTTKNDKIKEQPEEDKDFLGSINDREIQLRDLPKKGEHKWYIITAAQNNTTINKDFFKNILKLKDHFNAELIVSRLTYNKNFLNKAREKDSTEEENDIKIRYESSLQSFLNDDYIKLADDLVYLGYSDKLLTSPNPLGSSFHKGWDKSFILPHGRRQLESFPLTYEKSLTKRKIGYTTGVVTNRNYIQNEAGHKAEMYHYYGVCLVKVNSDGSHFTYQLPASNDGNFSLCFMDKMFVGGKVLENQSIEGLILGDTHNVKGHDTQVFQDFFGDNNIFSNLHIKNVVAHDTLDFECQSHHTEKDYLKRYVQHHTQDSDVFRELKITVDVLNKIKNIGDRLYVVESNHDQHLNQYLNGNWKIDDHINKLTNLLLNTIQYTKATVDNDINTSLINDCNYKPFLDLIKDVREHDGDIYEFIARKMIGLNPNVEFIDGNKDVYILDYLINLHGDKGVNGARSAHSLKKLSEKVIAGHVHSPSIKDFLILVGITGDKKNFDYATSASSWANCFCMIYPNGTAGLFFYDNGEF